MKNRPLYSVTLLSVFTLFLLSCDGSHITTSEGERDEAILSNTETVSEQAKMTNKPSPAEVSAAFFDMVEELQNMSTEQIEALNDEEVLKLGEPISLATEGTIQLSEKTLQQLREPLKELTDRFLTMTRDEYRALSSEIDKIITSDGDGGHERRSLTADQVRDLLVELSGETMSFSSTCEQMFVVQGQNVILMVGDNFNLANQYCPAGYQFTITSGIHSGQYVTSPKVGNSWVGTSSAIMDGQNNSQTALNLIENNSVYGFEIRNYTNFAIKDWGYNNNNISISYMTFKNIAVGGNGQTRGAIHFSNSSGGIIIQQSHFENVASAVRFIHSNGYITVSNNTAINPGRNFFQCINCIGGGIRINNNSMEHNQQIASVPLEDFINIFQSEGLSNDYIQVNNNRARVNLVNGNAIGVSNSGCMIILGDYGGEYQEAKNNIAVNPGNCGIGVAGGQNFKVENNKTYSQQINGISNVGIYAAAFPSSVACNHGPGTFSNNLSRFICGRNEPPPGVNCGIGSNNWAWAPNSGSHYCGITHAQIRDDSRVKEAKSDLELGPWIWDTW